MTASPDSPRERCTEMWTIGADAAITVCEHGRDLTFTFDEMCRYSGGNSPAGVAHAFKVLERALPALGGDAPVERRRLQIETAFGGPGTRDGFELVTRAATGNRYVVDRALARGELGPARERFVFRLSLDGGDPVTAVLREGFMTDEFVALAFADTRTDAQEQRLTELKDEVTDRLMAVSAEEAYDLELGG